MKIKKLQNDELQITTVASWLFNEWGRFMPGRTLESVTAKIRERVLSNQVPLTMVAVEGEQILGTASIVAEDLESHRHLSPWLASVFVPTEYRSKGIGSALCREIIEEARRIGLHELFLFTPDRASFYHELGWQDFDRAIEKSKEVVVMRYQLDTTR
jgi:N-acetylglutamate synthase-like GNAT family acetyltransferase